MVWSRADRPQFNQRVIEADGHRLFELLSVWVEFSFGEILFGSHVFGAFNITPSRYALHAWCLNLLAFGQK